MKTTILLLGLMVLFSAVPRINADEEPITIWRGAMHDGDKPGIGILLEVSGGNVVSGYYCLLDPDRPECFSVGRVFVMQDIRVEKLRLRFTLALKKEVNPTSQPKHGEDQRAKS